MGAHPYSYFTAYDPEIARALAALRDREFRAGRYDPALRAATPPTYTFQQSFPPTEAFPSPGAQHASIDEAMAASMESGTGSILDIMGISTSPQFLHACRSTHETLTALFGTSTPSHADVARDLLRASGDRLMKAVMFWDEIGRGECRHFIMHENGAPAELFFAGMSVD